MSTVLVVRKGATACIAADSLTTWGSHLREKKGYEINNEKIFKYNDAYFGMVGFAGNQIVLRSYLSGLKEKADLTSQEAIFEFWRKMHKELKDQYFVNPRDEKDDPYESSRIGALILNPHGMYYVSDLRFVACFAKFWAIGSGQEYALGALYANYDRYKNPVDIAKAAMAAACEFDIHSDQPSVYYTVKLVTEKARRNKFRHSPRAARKGDGA